MGAAIGYALQQSVAVTFAVFSALALGLAAPYVALTLQPTWTRFLPRPGVWMDLLKQATAIPIFATVIWLAADGTRTLREIVENEVCTQFEIDPETALLEAEEFAARLAERSILRLKVPE